MLNFLAKLHIISKVPNGFEFTMCKAVAMTFLWLLVVANVAYSAVGAGTLNFTFNMFPDHPSVYGVSLLLTLLTYFFLYMSCVWWVVAGVFSVLDKLFTANFSISVTSEASIRNFLTKVVVFILIRDIDSVIINKTYSFKSADIVKSGFVIAAYVIGLLIPAYHISNPSTFLQFFIVICHVMLALMAYITTCVVFVVAVVYSIFNIISSIYLKLKPYLPDLSNLCVTKTINTSKK